MPMRYKKSKRMMKERGHEILIGSRAQVWHGTAYKTSGGLTKTDLMMNKEGRIVSKSKHITAKREKRLVNAGYVTRKGHFGFIKRGSRSSKRMRGGSHALSPGSVGDGDPGTSGPAPFP